VLTAVTSQVRGLPAHQGTRVRPSGLFSSRRVRPIGSFAAGMPADEKALIDDIVQRMASGSYRRSRLTHKTMETAGIDH